MKSAQGVMMEPFAVAALLVTAVILAGVYAWKRWIAPVIELLSTLEEWDRGK